MEPVRRPEVEKMAAKIQLKNPSWTKERCVTEAKRRWEADQAFKRKLLK